MDSISETIGKHFINRKSRQVVKKPITISNHDDRKINSLYGINDLKDIGTGLY